jgi:inhibitor of KinA sporulation pathway (predicted exonuclease)
MDIPNTPGRRAVVFDMEWNQPLPWKQYPHVPKSLMPGEIIQIGAVMLDAAGKSMGEFSISVRPKYFRQVHWKVKKLTHISEADMLDGVPFPEAVQRFGEWCRTGGGDFDMFAWGGEDERVLCGNLEAWGLDPAWVPRQIYDLRLIFDSFRGRTETSTSLTDAAAALGCDLDLEQHDSLNDARYAAAVCAATDIRRGVEEYEELGPGPALSGGEQRRYETGFAEPGDGLYHPRLCSCVCPVCGEALRCRAWVPQNKDRQIAVLKCSRGHGAFLRVRFSRRPNGLYSALRLVYGLTEEAESFYQKKLQKQQESLRRLKKLKEKAKAARQGEPEAKGGPGETQES